MPETILVTGASGYIAKHTVHHLLEKGYTVRGTVRTPQRAENVRQIMPADSHERLHFATADLMKDEGWAEAMQGCDAVMHIASPLSTEGGEDAYVRPAVEGTRRVLGAAAQAGVRRVVMTSSVAAIGRGHSVDDTATFTEDDWSDPDRAEPYSKSKTLAERTAWAFADEHPDFELVAINPAMVIGPLLDDRMSTSVETIKRPLANAYPALPKLGWCFVDVRDVAAAHYLALTTPEAAGERFICAHEWRWLRAIAEQLDTHYPDRDITTRPLPTFIARLIALFDPTLKRVSSQLERKIVYDNEKIRRVLGWQPHDMRESIIETADSLIAHGIVK